MSGTERWHIAGVVDDGQHAGTVGVKREWSRAASANQDDGCAGIDGHRTVLRKRFNPLIRMTFRKHTCTGVTGLAVSAGLPGMENLKLWRHLL